MQLNSVLKSILVPGQPWKTISAAVDLEVVAGVEVTASFSASAAAAAVAVTVAAAAVVEEMACS